MIKIRAKEPIDLQNFCIHAGSQVFLWDLGKMSPPTCRVDNSAAIEIEPDLAALRNV